MRYPVEFDARHLEHLSGPLLTGVIELLWNSIDADATNIKVVLRDNGLTGISEVEVIDDGHGIDLETARETFLPLGRSWKVAGARSKTLQRTTHGQKGHGRFRLFRHGGIARWRSVAQVGDALQAVEITIRTGDGEIEINEIELAPDATVGTSVLLFNFDSLPQGLKGKDARDRLLGTFVLPIEQHGLAITYDDKRLNPDLVREGQEDLKPVVTPAGPLPLNVIRWTRQIGKQDLFLCDAEGAVLEKVPSEVAAPGIHFSAYVRWDGFADHLANVSVVDLDSGDLGRVVRATREGLADHFGELAEQRQRQVIAEWRKEGVYPFKGTPASPGEQAARDTFDVVSIEAAETVNKAPKASRKLSLRLLRETLERNPGHVHQILGEVLSLPEERLADLSRLLERTQLSKIISTSRSIADRLDFLAGLWDLTCDTDISGDVLERLHLHLILEDESWVFGEEYGLAASEYGLTKLLQKHVELLGREEINPTPVRGNDGKIQRVDLMLAQAVPHTDNRREHLVIELKRPNVPIGPKELQQVKEYALTVAQDDRFDTAHTNWEFWAVSTSVKGTVETDRRQSGKPFGLVSDDAENRVRIWVKKWSEIIQDADHRLKYVRDQLGVSTDQQNALEYLRRVHADKLPDSLTEAEEEAQPAL